MRAGVSADRDTVPRHLVELAPGEQLAPREARRPLAAAVAGGDEDGGGQSQLAQAREGVLVDAAVAVVEGEDEGALRERPSGGEGGGEVQERQRAKARRAQPREPVAQRRGRISEDVRAGLERVESEDRQAAHGGVDRERSESKVREAARERGGKIALAGRRRAAAAKIGGGLR